MTFCKAERLCSKLQVEELFAGGSKSFSIYPIRVVFRSMPKTEQASASPMASILISVPKKRFKRAVKRNRVKRQLREAYRKQKNELLRFLEKQEEGMAIAFIYLSDELVSTAEIEHKMGLLLARIIEKSA